MCQSTCTPSLAHSLPHPSAHPWEQPCADARRDPRSIPKSSQCPILAFILSAVASIQPQVREERKVRICPPQSSVLIPSQIPSPWRYYGPWPLEYETLGVHQDVSLTSFDLLAAVVAPILSPYCCTLHRLGSHHACAGLWISLQANSQTFADSPVDMLPGAVDAPGSEIVVNGGPSLGKWWGSRPHYWQPLFRT